PGSRFCRGGPRTSSRLPSSERLRERTRRPCRVGAAGFTRRLATRRASREFKALKDCAAKFPAGGAHAAAPPDLSRPALAAVVAALLLIGVLRICATYKTFSQTWDNQFAWLQEFKPAFRVGKSIWVDYIPDTFAGSEERPLESQ